MYTATVFRRKGESEGGGEREGGRQREWRWMRLRERDREMEGEWEGARGRGGGLRERGRRGGRESKREGDRGRGSGRDPGRGRRGGDIKPHQYSPGGCRAWREACTITSSRMDPCYRPGSPASVIGSFTWSIRRAERCDFNLMAITLWSSRKH